MEFFNRIITHYGWEGTALAGVLLVMFGIQLYYYLFVYGRIPKYKDTRRPEILSETPPVSVVIPLFSEDYAFVEEILPLIVAQEYPDFEVVIVYVGRDTDFYDDLVRIKQSFPQITATKIELNPRFPISPKMALNVGIKSAHYEHLLFTTPDVYPSSDRWLSLMANGFRRGEIVLGYCGMERGKGFASYLIRTWRMMHSVDWISSAVCGRPYRGMRQNYGFTKRLYFGANGFSHLNMNIGEDDLFMSRIIAPGNVSVVLSPRATLREKSWGGLKWWIGTQRFFGGAIPFYPLWVKNFIQWELGSRILFWLAAIDAGKKSGFWATIFGGAAQLIMGNAVPGLVLGILIGKGVEESGWNRVTKVMMVAIVALFVLSGFFRGFDMKMIESFHLTVPNWLDMIHNSLSGK